MCPLIRDTIYTKNRPVWAEFQDDICTNIAYINMNRFVSVVTFPGLGVHGLVKLFPTGSSAFVCVHVKMVFVIEWIWYLPVVIIGINLNKLVRFWILYFENFIWKLYWQIVFEAMSCLWILDITQIVWQKSCFKPIAIISSRNARFFMNTKIVFYF